MDNWNYETWGTCDDCGIPGEWKAFTSNDFYCTEHVQPRTVVVKAKVVELVGGGKGVKFN